MMRVWRFDALGQRVDALEWSDTIALADFSEVSNRFKDRATYEAHAHWDKYDYVCFWQGIMFPVWDREITSQTALETALTEREAEGIIYRYYA